MQEELKGNEVNVEVNNEKDCKKVITLEISGERFNSEKEKVVGELSRETQIPGFRKGKVPRNIIRQRFSEQIMTEALKKILPVAYDYAITTEELNPIGEPVFRDVETGDEDQPLKFVVDVETIPELEVEDYRGLDVTDYDVNVDEADVSRVLGRIQKQNADYHDVDRAAATSDLVVIDYGPVGLDDKMDQEKKVEDYKIQLGEGQILKDFEEAVVGKRAGERDRVTIEYPPDFQPQHLAGQKILYEFMVKEVKERRLPPLNDEFASNLTDQFDNLEDLKADITKRLRYEKEKDVRKKREQEAIDKLIEKNPFEIPLSMVERFKSEMIKDDDRRRETAHMGKIEDEEEKEKRDQLFDKVARRNIKRFFIIDYIARKEKVEVTPDEIGKEIEEAAEASGDTVKEVKEKLAEKRDSYRDLENALIERKVFNIILDPDKDGEN